MITIEKTSAGLILADFLQLPPVKGRFIFSQFSNKYSMTHLLGLQ